MRYWKRNVKILGNKETGQGLPEELDKYIWLIKADTSQEAPAFRSGSSSLLEFDIDEIKKAGYVLTTPIIITNTDEYLDVLEMKKENVEFGDELITIVK